MIEHGKLTWECEIGPHSRRPHWPEGESGATWGPGLDIRERSWRESVDILTGAGVDKDDAEAFSVGAGLRGAEAKIFVNDLPPMEMTEESQERLFEYLYARKVELAKFIGSKPDLVAIYGETDWEGLHPAIFDVMVDFFYRGGSTGSSGPPKGGTRKRYHRFVVANDLQGFHDCVADRDFWSAVPLGRFEARVEHLKKALDRI